jgi:hypothetical protein
VNYKSLNTLRIFTQRVGPNFPGCGNILQGYSNPKQCAWRKGIRFLGCRKGGDFSKVAVKTKTAGPLKSSGMVYKKSYLCDPTLSSSNLDR